MYLQCIYIIPVNAFLQETKQNYAHHLGKLPVLQGNAFTITKKLVWAEYTLHFITLPSSPACF